MAMVRTLSLPASQPTKISLIGIDSSDSDSWNLVPSSQPPSRHGSVFRPPPAPVDTRMKEENDKLRAELEEVKARLSSAEVIIKTRRGQEAQLRESIMIAKREVCPV